MKYQIILESEELLSDEEITSRIKDGIDAHECAYFEGFKLVEARSLEGIREEVWKRKEELKEELKIDPNIFSQEEQIDKTFDSLDDLFKLN